MQAVAGDVADGEPDEPVGQGDDVIPVAPDLQVGGCGHVAGGDADAGHLGDAVGQQAALERLGDLVLAVGAGLLDGQLLLGLGALTDLLDEPRIGGGELERALLHPLLELGGSRARACSPPGAAR